MKLSEFDYELPPGLIAQEPLRDREKARLLVLEHDTGSIIERTFRDIIDYVDYGDCLVLNNTRVIPVRLFGTRKTGGKVEIFLLDVDSDSPRALIRPSKKIRENEEITLKGGIRATILGPADVGRFVKFDAPIKEVLKNGHVPLPPYISREDTPEDKEGYQTVFAARDGATASPTAGLHFTKELLNILGANGVLIAYVTLHTSYGTFAPVKSENIEEHKMHAEHYEIDESTANIVNSTKASGKKVFAVGTTSARALETAAMEKGKIAPSSGETDLFIYPGYDFKMLDGMVTNFHLPKSTLLMMISAFAGKDLVFKAYREAIKKKLRFYSYGDAMLVI